MNESLEGMNQKERLHEFFTQYVKPTGRLSYDPDGNISFATMKEAVALLLENHVFESDYEMKMEALREFEVIIPYELFEKDG